MGQRRKSDKSRKKKLTLIHCPRNPQETEVKADACRKGRAVSQKLLTARHENNPKK